MFPVTLLEKKTVAEFMMEFFIQRPEGFQFTAGQHIDIVLPRLTNPDKAGNKRTLSIASAPDEPRLRVATRIRDSAFKCALRDAEQGEPLEISEAEGSFTLHQDASKPAVFLTGGIGVTPVLSIVRDAVNRKLAHKITVFCANRRPEDGAFVNELEALEEQNPNYMFVPTMTRMDLTSMPWNGEAQSVTVDLISQYATLDRMDGAIWYLTGPVSIVNGMRSLLEQMRVDPDNIRIEEFPGYEDPKDTIFEGTTPNMTGVVG